MTHGKDTRTAAQRRHDHAEFERGMTEPWDGFAEEGHTAIVRPEKPPKGFRKAIPLSVKLRLLRRQDFTCGCGCGEPLDIDRALKIVCQFDHRPALYERAWDPVAGDTIPAANDTGSLYALKPGHHLERTKADHRQRGKTNRLAKGADAHAAAMADKEPGRPRPRSGKIRSRNDLRGRKNARTRPTR